MSEDRIDGYLLEVMRGCWEAALPAPVEALARDLLLDTLGCAIAGAGEPEVRALARALGAHDPGPLRFPGLAEGLTSLGLATWFAAASCWHEACEGLPTAHGRPGLHALPAVLGPALARPTRLDAVLRALIAGYEVGGRLGAICRIRPGMHVDGTWGSFAAAAALARLLGLTPEQCLGALNHAACHMPFSLYRPIAAGSTARNAYPGHGARHGAMSVLAAQAGLAGPAGSITAMAELALGRAAPDLGAPPGAWVLAEGYLKSYPAVKHAHYGVAVAEAFHAARPFDAAGIERVNLDIYAEAITYCGNRRPETAIAAQFSLSYCLAWSLLHGRLVPAAFSPASLGDPAIRALEARIVVRQDAALTAAGLRGARVSVEGGGRRWEGSVSAVKGDPADRLGRTELVGKFRAFAVPVIGGAACEAIAGLVLDGAAGAVFALPDVQAM